MSSDEAGKKKPSEFDKAVEWVNAQRNIRIPGKKIEDYRDELLTLYGLYKQATVGDVDESTFPKGVGTMFDMLIDTEGYLKRQAWLSRKGMSRSEARTKYVLAARTLRKKLVS